MQHKKNKTGRPIEWNAKRVEDAYANILQALLDAPMALSPAQAIVALGLPSDILDVNKQSISRPAKEFANKINMLIEGRIIEEVRAKRLSSDFGKFLLKSKHNYDDKAADDVQQVVHHHIPHAKLAEMNTDELKEQIRRITGA